MMNPAVVGRGSSFNPANRYEKLSVGPPPTDLAHFFEGQEAGRKEPTIFFRDESKSIISENDSPDVPFTYSLNPYRGCEHGCCYCYARPTHEYLGFSAGLDFESRIMVKDDAPVLLERALDHPKWDVQTITLSGNTDCYQPVEQRLKITRRCLEVFLKFRHPVAIITKNALIQRDVDLLRELASMNLTCVFLSVTTLRQEVASRMEPRTSSIRKRLETIRRLTDAGVPVGVMVAPLIPGLNDEEIPSILKAAKEHGAVQAGYVLLRLPHAVKEIFVTWLEREFPERAAKILGRIRSVREGKLSEGEYGKRMAGSGPVATAINRLFSLAVRRSGIEQRRVELATHLFRKPRMVDQGELF